MKHIVFFCDWQMLPGLHVSLLSLLESLKIADPLHIVVFADKLPLSEKELLKKTHEIQPKNTTFEIRDYSADKLKGGSDLHGNTTAYGVFYLADELLPEVDLCLTLDSDILVNTNVHKMFEYFDENHILLVDGTAERKWDYHKLLYEAAGLDMEKPCFNSGITGINLELWREKKITQRCQEVALKYTDMLAGSDQAILNIALHQDFLAWGSRYNTSLRLKNPTIDKIEDVIYHFVGAPKPWDLFGRSLHNNYSVWKEVYDRTAAGNVPLRRYISINRTRKIWRSVVRVWMNNRKAKSGDSE
ncbi:MAG: glycosyltransferase [Verrucomicrobiota bacterium]